MFIDAIAPNIDTQNRSGEQVLSGKKVSGIGGIFFKAENPKELRSCYGKNLGLALNEYGSMFETQDSDKHELVRYLQWSPFNKNTKYFEPSDKPFMINYRMENIEDLVDDLRANGVTVVDSIETYEYGKFVTSSIPKATKLNYGNRWITSLQICMKETLQNNWELKNEINIVSCSNLFHKS